MPERMHPYSVETESDRDIDSKYKTKIIMVDHDSILIVHLLSYVSISICIKRQILHVLSMCVPYLDRAYSAYPRIMSFNIRPSI